MHLGRREEALSALNQAIENEPGNPSLHLQLARVLEQIKERREAHSSYRRALKLAEERLATAPGNENHLALVGNIRSLLAISIVREANATNEEANEAVKLLELVIKSTQSPKNCYFIMGMAQYRAGHWNDAITALQNSQKMNSGGTAGEQFFLAMAYL